MKNLAENNVLIKELFDFFYVNEKQLTARQIEFINSIKRYYKKNESISEKQFAALFEIKKYLNISGQPARFSGALIKA